MYKRLYIMRSSILEKHGGADIGLQLLTAHFFYISNLVTKAPGLNLDKKLSNLLNNGETLN